MIAARLPNPVVLAEEDPAPVSLRESSIVTLAAHGVLDARQVAAAFRFRNACEELAGRRQSYLLDRIDEIPVQTARLEREDAARRELGRYRDLLGRHGFELLVRVCGEGHHIRDLYATRRERDTAVDMLRIHLDSLAELTCAHPEVQDRSLENCIR